MAANLKTMAFPDFLPFDLSELHDIYTSVKDGAYWSAFRKSIRLIDRIVNPSLSVSAISENTLNPVDPEKIEDVLTGLEMWVEQAEATAPGVRAIRTKRDGEENVDAIPIIEIVSVVKIILELVKQWRDYKRSRPKMAAAEAPKIPLVPNVTPVTPVATPTQPKPAPKPADKK